MAGSELPVRIVDGNGQQVTSFGGGGSTANPSVTSEKSSDNLVTGQVAVGTTSTLVVAARAGRKTVTLTPTSSTVYYIGNTGVTTANGMYVAAGGTVTLTTTAAIYAVGAAALTISFGETF